MISLSPGVAQGCFELIGIVSRNRLTFHGISSSFPYIGGLSITRIIETAQVLGWIRACDEGHVIVSPAGANVINICGYEARLRQALLDYIDSLQPPWVQNATFGRSRVLAFSGNEIAQVFIEAGLASGTDSAVVAFWDELASRARGVKNGSLTAIGRIGERLSLKLEEKRTGRIPKWVAIDNNADGYDILSTVSQEDTKQLSIEVKTSTLGLSGALHVSRNEWERALECPNHVFHLWDIQRASSPHLAIVSPDELKDHIPDDNGKGYWECVEVPFSAFSSRFAATPA